MSSETFHMQFGEAGDESVTITSSSLDNSELERVEKDIKHGGDLAEVMIGLQVGQDKRLKVGQHWMTVRRTNVYHFSFEK